MDRTNEMPEIKVSIKKMIDFKSIERLTECALCLEQFKEPRILPCNIKSFISLKSNKMTMNIFFT